MKPPIPQAESGDRLMQWVEIVGRPIRWIFETSLFCIAGTFLLGAFRGGFPLSMFFGDADTWAWTWHLPAVGWWVGLLGGLVRMPAVLKKPIFTEIEEGEEEEENDSKSNVNVFDRAAARQRPLRLRFRSAGKGMLYGMFAGGFVGLMISVSTCAIAAAAILSPVAPSHWTDQLSVETHEEHRLVGIDDPAARSHGSSFWHPAFGWIIVIGLGGSTGIGTVGLGLAGWYSVDESERND